MTHSSTLPDFLAVCPFINIKKNIVEHCNVDCANQVFYYSRVWVRRFPSHDLITAHSDRFKWCLGGYLDGCSLVGGQTIYEDKSSHLFNGGLLVRIVLPSLAGSSGIMLNCTCMYKTQHYTGKHITKLTGVNEQIFYEGLKRKRQQGWLVQWNHSLMERFSNASPTWNPLILTCIPSTTSLSRASQDTMSSLFSNSNEREYHYRSDTEDYSMDLFASLLDENSYTSAGFKTACEPPAAWDSMTFPLKRENKGWGLFQSFIYSDTMCTKNSTPKMCQVHKITCIVGK